MKIRLVYVACLLFSLVISATTNAADVKSAVLINNANIFDGKNEKLATGMSVLVEGNKIAKIAKSIPAPAGATVIDAKGKTLMPGLIDAHWHVMFSEPTFPELMNSDIGWLTLLGARGARDTLLRGFTTVRDVGGGPFAIKTPMAVTRPTLKRRSIWRRKVSFGSPMACRSY